MQLSIYFWGRNFVSVLKFMLKLNGYDYINKIYVPEGRQGVIVNTIKLLGWFLSWFYYGGALLDLSRSQHR